MLVLNRDANPRRLGDAAMHYRLAYSDTGSCALPLSAGHGPGRAPASACASNWAPIPHGVVEAMGGVSGPDGWPAPGHWNWKNSARCLTTPNTVPGWCACQAALVQPTAVANAGWRNTSFAVQRPAPARCQRRRKHRAATDALDGLRCLAAGTGPRPPRLTLNAAICGIRRW